MNGSGIQPSHGDTIGLTIMRISSLLKLGHADVLTLRPLLGCLTILALSFLGGPSALAQTYEPLPPVGGNTTGGGSADDSYRPAQSGRADGGYGADSIYNRGSQPYDPNYGEPDRGTGRGNGRPVYRPETQYEREPNDNYGAPYRNPDTRDRDNGGEYYRRLPPRDGEGYADDSDTTYSQGEIIRAGHGFFGSVSKGLASAVEYAFENAGRPNGYILGEDAGGAFVAGLRYGEGRLHTRRYGSHKVFWQGPTLGYDFGAEGSKTMVLVYNLRHPSQIYERFGGVEGSAYLVGGVSVQFQKRGNVTLAPIRAGVGLRLGANVGYLKYTRSPTWNPF